MKKLSLLLLTLGLALPAFAQTKTLLNLDKTGVAIQGYDPVAFFTASKPVKGKPELAIKRDGALYYFASKEHRELFKSDPPNMNPYSAATAPTASRKASWWKLTWTPSKS